jgi:cellulose synthase/poly-beta-1,6-N-acetylglucosamine synthase-like glycosyltransferase
MACGEVALKIQKIVQNKKEQKVQELRLNLSGLDLVLKLFCRSSKFCEAETLMSAVAASFYSMLHTVCRANLAYFPLIHPILFLIYWFYFYSEILSIFMLPFDVLANHLKNRKNPPFYRVIFQVLNYWRLFEIGYPYMLE